MLWHPTRDTGVAALTAVFIVGTTGMDYTRVINPENVKAVTWVKGHVTVDTQVFTPGNKLVESLYLLGKSMFYLSRELMLRDRTTEVYPSRAGADYDPQASLSMLIRCWVEVLARVRYALASDRMKAFDERYGQQLASDQVRLEQTLRNTPGVTAAYQRSGAAVYELPESSVP